MIQLDKKYRTESGEAVRLFDIIPGQSYPVMGAAWSSGSWFPRRWDLSGNSDAFEELRLVEVKERDPVPLENLDELPRFGVYWLKDDGNIYLAQSVSEDGVHGFSWDTLYHEGVEYSSCPFGPWQPFAKEVGDE